MNVNEKGSFVSITSHQKYSSLSVGVDVYF